MKTTRHEESKVTDWLYCAIASRRSPAMKVAAVVLLVAGAAGWSAPSSAQAIVGADLVLTELEKAFWVCDHAATQGLIDTSTAITCSSLIEALKQRKFDGDFKALLAWSLQHKEAEHLALAKSGGPSLARLMPTAPR